MHKVDCIVTNMEDGCEELKAKGKNQRQVYKDNKV